jgi:class 3 adenylate cyclase/pimeloyl-ACP methyl ester carboxylesterase
MEREIRYCTTEDGVRIAYCVEGEGPDLVCCPEFVGSFSLDHLIDDQMGFWRTLWRGRRVVRYDMRGTGLSQRDVGDVTHDTLTLDVAAVVRASGAHRFTLWASTLSGPRAIDYAARHSEQLRRLVLHRTFARAADLMTKEQVVSFAELARLHPDTAAQAFADLPGRRELPDAGVHAAQVYSQSASGEFVARLLTRGFETTDVTPLLSSIRVPTLVLHWSDDPMFSFRLAQDLAAKIPQARLVPLREGIMNYLVTGRIVEVLDILNDFISDGAPSARPAPNLAAGSVQTILFTDIVGHTEMMQRLGDAKGRDVLREHERITRDVLKQHGGHEVKTMFEGDGFMASFGSVTKAMDCAIALQRAFASVEPPSPLAGEGLGVRAGLNAGEPIEEDGDLFGSTVIMASRIAAKAGAGEILIPEPLRHLLTGKSYVYADRGETMLKGFEDAVRLYEVRWQE